MSTGGTSFLSLRWRHADGITTWSSDELQHGVVPNHAAFPVSDTGTGLGVARADVALAAGLQVFQGARRLLVQLASAQVVATAVDLSEAGASTGLLVNISQFQHEDQHGGIDADGNKQATVYVDTTPACQNMQAIAARLAALTVYHPLESPLVTAGRASLAQGLSWMPTVSSCTMHVLYPASSLASNASNPFLAKIGKLTGSDVSLDHANANSPFGDALPLHLWPRYPFSSSLDEPGLAPLHARSNAHILDPMASGRSGGYGEGGSPHGEASGDVPLHNMAVGSRADCVDLVPSAGGSPAGVARHLPVEVAAIPRNLDIVHNQKIDSIQRWIDSRGNDAKSWAQYTCASTVPASYPVARLGLAHPSTVRFIRVSVPIEATNE